MHGIRIAAIWPSDNSSAFSGSVSRVDATAEFLPNLSMDIVDYNGEGRWSRAGILARYERFATEWRITRRDQSPMEHSDGNRRRVYPVMDKVIEGIEGGDAVCIQIGIEFIEENAKFPFGKILKANTARALRRAELSDDQKQRIRRRVFGLLRDGHVPHEFREYAKLVRKIGFDASEIPPRIPDNPYVERFRSYFNAAARQDS
jgi:hypothetical protein